MSERLSRACLGNRSVFITKNGVKTVPFFSAPLLRERRCELQKLRRITALIVRPPAQRAANLRRAGADWGLRERAARGNAVLRQGVSQRGLEQGHAREVGGDEQAAEFSVGGNLCETPLVFEFSVCLSRACLGKIMHLIYKWRKKWRFSHRRWRWWQGQVSEQLPIVA